MSEQLHSCLCPAKINLFLLVHGPRKDGFHELTSLVAPIAFGDQLSLISASGKDSLYCNDSKIPTDDSNLVLKAAAVFRKNFSHSRAFAFSLDKKIPVGAGLGGGSSDAANALSLMNQAAGGPASTGELCAMAAEVGSDCPFFIQPAPKYMTGRGEKLENASPEIQAFLSRQRVLIFKPTCSVPTAWAYAQLRDNPQFYAPADSGRKLMEDWRLPESLDSSAFENTFEQVVLKKYLACRSLVTRVRQNYSLPVALSGSGSACFALAPAENGAFEDVTQCVKNSLGKSAFVIDTQFLSP